MEAKYLFNSKGEWIAFTVGEYVYDCDSDCIGWIPYDNDDVVDLDGDYLGTIFGNRLYNILNKPLRGYNGFKAYPKYPGYQKFPGYVEYEELPLGIMNVIIRKNLYI